MPYAWLMVAVTFCTQFLCMGFTFYSFGVMLKPLTEEFGSSRFGVTLLPLAMSLAGAVLAPIMGRWIARGSIRNIMTLGCFATAVGFLLGSRTTQLWQLGLIFGTLLTFGVATMGHLVSQSLVVNWFDEKRAMALGISLMGVSLSGMLMAHVTTRLLAVGGWRWAFELFGWVNLCAAPAVWFLVVGRPEERTGGPVSGRAGGHQAAGLATVGAALREPNLWIIAISTGLCFMGTTAILTHAIAFATDAGVPPARAAWVLSALAGGAAAGKLLFGWLAQRLGERAAFCVSLSMQIAGILGLLSSGSFAQLLVVGTFLGLGLGGVTPLASSLLARAFGRDAFGPMLGLMMPILTPFQSLGPPLAGWVFDVTGSYDAAWWTFAAAMGVAIWLLTLLRLDMPEAHALSTP